MSRGKAGGGGQAGFALIIVLWTMVLLTLLVTEIDQAGRNESQLALNLRRAAAQQAEADGAVAIAGFHLLGPTPSWSADGQSYVIPVDGDPFASRVTVRIEDQAGKIDLNTAPPPLLQALLAALGADPATAASLAGNIVAWRLPAGVGAAEAASAAPYKAASLDYGPPGAPFASLDELRLVLGMTPALLAALTPHLTVFTQTGTDPARADPVVRRALATAGGFYDTGAPPPGALRVVAITATASGAGGAVTRQAIVRLGPQKAGWMRILTWTRPGS